MSSRGRTFRSWLFWSHRWLGLALGLYVLVLSITGGLLVFRHEIERALEPGLYVSTPAASDSIAPLSTLLAAATGAAPDATANRVRYPALADGVVEVRFRDAAEASTFVFLDPATAAVRDVRPEDAGFMGFVFSLHVYLLMGEFGHKLSGWLGLAGLVLFITGGVLWLPRTLRSIAPRLVMSVRGSWSRRLYDLHTVGGLYALPWLVVVFLTGVAITFGSTTERIIETATGTATWPAMPKATSDAPPLPWDTLLAHAEREADRLVAPTRIAFVFPPRRPGDAFRTMHWGIEADPVVAQVSLEPSTGAVLAADRLDVASAGQTISGWITPLHYGRWGGLASRVLYVLGAIVTLCLTATGGWLFLRRRRAAGRIRRLSAAASRRRHGEDNCPKSFPD